MKTKIKTLPFSQWLDSTLKQKNLLTPIRVSTLAESSIHAIDGALTYLGGQHPIVKALTLFKDNPILVTAKYDEKQGFTPFRTNPLNTSFSKYSFTEDTGVYVMTQESVSRGRRQYLGSAVPFVERAKDHYNTFLGYRTKTYFHKEILRTEGTESVNWGTVYEYPSFEAYFKVNNPSHVLSLGEVQLLKGISQLLPRILEDSLIKSKRPALNGDPDLNLSQVTFGYNKWNINSFTDFNLAIPSRLGDIVVLKADTLEPVREESFRTRAEVARFLKLSNEKLVTQHLNSSRGYTPESVGYKIIFQLAGSSLVDDGSRNKPSEKEDLQLINQALTDLTPRWVFAFACDRINYVGPFVNIAEAAYYLNPLKMANVPEARAKDSAQAMKRAMNKHWLVDTELGKFYFARNPNSTAFTNPPKSTVRPPFFRANNVNLLKPKVPITTYAN